MQQPSVMRTAVPLASPRNSPKPCHKVSTTWHLTRLSGMCLVTPRLRVILPSSGLKAKC